MVFRAENDGSRVACGECASFQLAELRIQMLAASQPGEYIIVNKKTGKEVSLHLNRPKVRQRK